MCRGCRWNYKRGKEGQGDLYEALKKIKKKPNVCICINVHCMYKKLVSGQGVSFFFRFWLFALALFGGFSNGTWLKCLEAVPHHEISLVPREQIIEKQQPIRDLI